MTRRSRRQFLIASATTLVAPGLSSCAGLPFPGSIPLSSGPKHKVRVAGLYGGQNLGNPDERLSILLQQAVDRSSTIPNSAIDPHLTWIAIPLPVEPSPAHPYVSGEAQALDLVLNGTERTAGTFPDLVALYSSYVVQQVAAKNLLRPLDDLLHLTSLVNPAEYFPGALDAARLGGKLYGLPLGITPGMLQYDRSLFQEAGVGDPDGTWDWNRLLEICLELTKPPSQYAFSPYQVPGVQVFLWQNSADVLSKDGKDCTLADQSAVEAARFYGDLFIKHHVVAPFTPSSSATAVSSLAGSQMTFGNARIAMQFGDAANATQGLPNSIRLGEIFRGQVQATSLHLQSLLAMTSRAADPPTDFAALVALGQDVQNNSYLPARRTAAQSVDRVRLGVRLESDEAAAVIRAAEYARASTLDPEIAGIVSKDLELPLQSGTENAEQACRIASDAINTLLRQRASEH